MSGAASSATLRLLCRATMKSAGKSIPLRTECAATEDRFAWLEEDTPRAKNWLVQQREAIEQTLGQCLHGSFVRRRVSKFLEQDSVDAPIEAAGRYFYSRREAWRDHPNLYSRDKNGHERLLVDPAAQAGNCFASAVLLAVSPDGEAYAYGTRTGGHDDVAVKIVQTASGRVVGELPEFRKWRSMLSPDLKGYFYLRPAAEAAWILCRHEFGPPPSDIVLFGPVQVPDASCIAAQSSPDTNLILIRLHPNGLRGSTEYCLIDRRSGSVSPLFEFSHKFAGRFFGEELFVMTDWNAPQRRIVAIPAATPELAQWRDVVPEGAMPIQGFSIIGGMLFVRYLNGLASEIYMHSPRGDFIKRLEVPPNGSATTPVGTAAGQDAFYEFSSLTHPRTVFGFHIPSRTQEIWHRSTVPFEFEAVETKQVWYQSRDGTSVPLTLTYRNDIALGPDTPVMLTAYGGFGVVETPRFTHRSALWIELGGVFAKASIRGGGEFGEEWHQAAVREKRQNAFDDFIAAAEWLIANGYTTARRLAIVGGSNSGLLVGAALTQRPDLFAAVVCFGPILDLLRYHLFPGSEVALNEYGCVDNPEEFEYLRKLSPYHNVADGVHYPAVLFISGDADTRCHPMHARKMCARLQEATASGRPILLDYHEQRGHAGFLPLNLRIQTLTRQFCFLLTELGLTIGANGRMQVCRDDEARLSMGQ